MQNNGKDLSAIEVVKWLKEQSKVFQHMAGQIEAAFSLGQPVGNTPQLPKLGLVTPQDVRDAISEKSMRVADLAKRFGVHEGQIQQIIDLPENGLNMGNRGWIRLAESKNKE